jgi:hypothetical protein
VIAMTDIQIHRGYEIHAEQAGYGFVAHLPNYDGEACLHGWTVDEAKAEINQRVEEAEPAVNLFDAVAARRRELAELVEETDGADAKGRLAYLDGKSGNDNPYLESGGWSQQPEAAYEWHESFLDEMKLSERAL